MSHITSITVPSDVTQCPVCCELLVDARQLPDCLHVYCLHCIEASIGWRRPEDEIGTFTDDENPKNAACPLCAVTFDVPEDGPVGLPRSGFIEKLIEIRKLKRALEDDTGSGCELCFEPERQSEEPESDGGAPSIGKKAAHYCVDCAQRMCDQCGTMHRRMKATSGHQLLDLGAKAAAAAEAIEKQLRASMSATTSCTVHPAENLKVYCNDCTSAICTMCHIESHNGHDCSDISRVADDLRRCIRDDVRQLNGHVSRCRSETTRLERAKADFARTVLKIQMQVGDSAERLKRLVDDHRKRLLVEVTSVGDSRRRETESVEADVNRHLSALETFCRYADELADQGSACDVAEAASRIRRRADMLRLFDVNEHVADNFRPMNFTFTAATTATSVGAGTNLVGSVSVTRDEEKGHDKVIVPSPPPPGSSIRSAPPEAPVVEATNSSHTAPPTEVVTPVEPEHTPTIVQCTQAGGRPVLGVTAAGDEVYVTRQGTPEIEVYEAVGLTLRRRIQMPGLGSWPYGLAVGTGCLYVSDFVNNAVHRAETVGMSTVTARWQVPGGPAGLSVISDGDDVGSVVVVCSTSLKIQVYAAPQGTLTFEIRLRPDLTPGPTHAIRLIGGQFLLSHASGSGAGQTQLHRICIVEKVEHSDEIPAGAAGAGAAPTAAEQSHKSHKKILPVLRRESKKPAKPAELPASVEGAAHVASFEGRVVLSYGAAPGSGDGQLSAPRGVAVDHGRGACVFIADRDNNRVVAYHHALGVGHPLKLTVGPGVEDGQLHGPRGLYLDSQRGRLYVGEESEGGRLVAIDHVDTVIRDIV